jgi:hypothetical protein
MNQSGPILAIGLMLMHPSCRLVQATSTLTVLHWCILFVAFFVVRNSSRSGKGAKPYFFHQPRMCSAQPDCDLTICGLEGGSRANINPSVFGTSFLFSPIGPQSASLGHQVVCVIPNPFSSRLRFVFFNKRTWPGLVSLNFSSLENLNETIPPSTNSTTWTLLCS